MKRAIVTIVAGDYFEQMARLTQPAQCLPEPAAVLAFVRQAFAEP